MKRRLFTRNHAQGFTLVEVLASLVIISIVLLGVYQMFTFTTKAAQSNNTKLVTTHLAKATIERIKMQSEDYFVFSNSNQIYTKGNCTPENCGELYEILVNDKAYDVTIKVSQTNNEKTLGLINVVVEVKEPDKNIVSTVEGYVDNE